MMSIISLVAICIGAGQAFRLDSGINLGVDARIPITKIPNNCVTGTGSTCVFPFKYKVSLESALSWSPGDRCCSRMWSTLSAPTPSLPCPGAPPRRTARVMW